MSKKPLIVFLMLMCCFMLYSFSIYFKPASSAGVSQEKAKQGRLVWQKYNCQACHQLYGLGGYLGPDLTNVMGTPHKDKTYIAAMLKSGIRQMPAFHIEQEEFEQLIAFLQSTNASGTASPASFTISHTGMIQPHE